MTKQGQAVSVLKLTTAGIWTSPISCKGKTSIIFSLVWIYLVHLFCIRKCDDPWQPCPSSLLLVHVHSQGFFVPSGIFRKKKLGNPTSAGWGWFPPLLVFCFMPWLLLISSILWCPDVASSFHVPPASGWLQGSLAHAGSGSWEQGWMSSGWLQVKCLAIVIRLFYTLHPYWTWFCGDMWAMCTIFFSAGLCEKHIAVCFFNWLLLICQ